MVIWPRSIPGILLGWWLLVCPAVLHAAQFLEPRLTQAVKEVRIADPDSSPSPASLNQVLRDGLLKTGPNSRAEITCKDSSIFRLGDNTTADVQCRGRTLGIRTGAILAQVPRGVGSTLI